MKRFLNIRNILILLIIIIAIIYICCGRSDDIKKSKTYKLFNSFYNYDTTGNYDKTTLKLNYMDEKKEITIIYATDGENGREIRSFDVNDKQSNEHGQSIAITTKNGLNNYILSHTEKVCLRFETLEESSSEFYASWCTVFIDLITKSSYYTRGYEYINGNLMYYEYFKDTNSKFYFNKNNELTYINSATLDSYFKSSFTTDTNNSKLYLFDVTISHNDIDNSLIEIPKEYEIKNAEDME